MKTNVAALQLVGTVIDALRESGDSSIEYRSLLGQLHTLESALLRVKRVELDDSQHAEGVALVRYPRDLIFSDDDILRVPGPKTTRNPYLWPSLQSLLAREFSDIGISCSNKQRRNASGQLMRSGRRSRNTSRVCATREVGVEFEMAGGRSSGLYA